MKKKSGKSTPRWVGMIRERRCEYPKRKGTLLLWDCERGAPMPIGENGERWAVQWQPGGKGEPKHVHLPNQRTALACFRTLAAGKERDQWGLFELPESKPEQTVGQITESPSPGGGVVQAPPKGLTAALLTGFSDDEIVTALKSMMAAERPIYGSADGTQAVVGFEPDWQTRREGLKLVLQYREGLPLKRVAEIRRHESSAEEVRQRIATLPGYRAAFREFIEHCDQEQKRKLENIMRADVEEVEGPED
jgi:hypothetical protein